MEKNGNYNSCMRKGGLRMRDVREFMESAADVIADMINNRSERKVKLSYVRVVKINDQALNGLRLEREGDNAAPVLYLDEMYDAYMEGEKFDTLVMQAFEAFMQVKDAEPHERPDADEDIFSRGHLAVRVIEKSRNTEYLKEHPSRDLGNGFAAVCDIVVRDSAGMWRSAVTRELAEKYEAGVQQMFDAALGNAEKYDPAVMMSLETMLEAMVDPAKRMPAGINVRPGASSYVLTNRSKAFGAAALFYPGIAEKLNDSFYALPSSLSEFIIVPAGLCASARQLGGIVKRVNAKTVPAEEVLSDRVLFYDKKEQRLIGVSADN